MARSRALGGKRQPFGGDRARRLGPRHRRGRRDQLVAVVEDRLDVPFLGEHGEPVRVIGVSLLQELDRIGALARQLDERILLEPFACGIPKAFPVGPSHDIRHQALLQRVGGHHPKAAQRAADDLGRVILDQRGQFVGLLVAHDQDVVNGR